MGYIHNGMRQSLNDAIIVNISSKTSQYHIGISWQHIAIYPSYMGQGMADEYSWWRHDMEKLSALLALCGGHLWISHAKRVVMWRLVISFLLSRASYWKKQLSCLWIEDAHCGHCITPSCRSVASNALATVGRIAIAHLPLDKMAVISQTIFSDARFWMKSLEFWFKFHWNLFPRVQLTISQQWFR